MLRHASCALFLAVLLIGSPSWGKTAEEYKTDGITIIHLEDTRPLIFQGEEGTVRGFLADLWRLWSQKTGIPVRFKLMAWKDTIPAVRNGEGDVHGGLMVVDERREYFLFSTPIFRVNVVMITKSVEGESPPSVETILGNYPIGVTSNAYPGKHLMEKYPLSNITGFQSRPQMIDAFDKGEVEAIFIDAPTFHFNNANREKPIQYAMSKAIMAQDLHAGVVKTNPQLQQLINEGFAQITPAEHQQIYNLWYVGGGEETHSFHLTGWIALCLIFIGGGIFFTFKITSRKSNTYR